MIQGAMRLYIATMPEHERQELRQRTAAEQQTEPDGLKRLKSAVFLRMCEEVWKQALDNSVDM